ncbi:hypothetical protein WA026_005665, partial [Henosepilachna vigintioctopunctata]
MHNGKPWNLSQSAECVRFVAPGATVLHNKLKHRNMSVIPILIDFKYTESIVVYLLAEISKNVEKLISNPRFMIYQGGVKIFRLDKEKAPIGLLLELRPRVPCLLR